MFVRAYNFIINRKIRNFIVNEASYFSSAVRVAPEMFKTGVISMYVHMYYHLTVILTFFLPRFDFFINEKEQNFRIVHIMNMCWRNANLSSPLSSYHS